MANSSATLTATFAATILHGESTQNHRHVLRLASRQSHPHERIVGPRHQESNLVQFLWRRSAVHDHGEVVNAFGQSELQPLQRAQNDAAQTSVKAAVERVQPAGHQQCKTDSHVADEQNASLLAAKEDDE